MNEENGQETQQDGRKSKKRRSTEKQAMTVEGVMQGKSLHRAGLDAGYSPHTARSMLYKPQENARTLEALKTRREAALKVARLHTDSIIGALVEIAFASLGDVLNDEGEFDINWARENRVDHLIKKFEKTVRYGKEGERTETCKYEMYSRLDALDQLRDIFGIKHEPRHNEDEEIKRRWLERSLNRLMERQGIDRPTAARLLLDELGDDAPELSLMLSEYVN